MSSLSQRLRQKTANNSPEVSPSPSHPAHSNPTAEKLVALLASLESMLDEDAKSGPLFYAIKKLAPRMTRDLAQIPEDQLKQGMSQIAHGLLQAVGEEGEMLQFPIEQSG